MPPTTDLESIGGAVSGALFDVGFPGQLATQFGACDTESRVNENATALDEGDVACRGVAVSPGTIGNCKPMVSGGVVIGITVRERSRQAADVAGTFNFPQYSTVRLLKIGWIWATAAEAVTEGDACIGVVATKGAVGGATGGAVNGTTRLAFPAGWQWEQTVASAAVGLIHAVSV